MNKKIIIGLMACIFLLVIATNVIADTVYSVTVTVQNISIPILGSVKYPIGVSGNKGAGEPFRFYYSPYPVVWIKDASAQPVNPEFYNPSTYYLDIGTVKTFTYTCPATCSLKLNLTGQANCWDYWNVNGQHIPSASATYCLVVYDKDGYSFNYQVSSSIVTWDFGNI